VCVCVCVCVCVVRMPCMYVECMRVWCVHLCARLSHHWEAQEVTERQAEKRQSAGPWLVMEER